MLVCVLCFHKYYGITNNKQLRKTSHLRGFVFSNYQNLNNGNLLLELGEILKQKWHKMTKNGMLKLT